MKSPLPYYDSFYPLLRCVHNALQICVVLHERHGLETLSADIPEIVEVFDEFEGFYKTGVNKHITIGLTKTDQERRNIYPRLGRITIQAYKESQAIAKNPNFKGVVIPSPLNVVFTALTVPSEPQTSSYAHALCRSMLFYFMNLAPKSNGNERNRHERVDFLTETDIIDSLSSFRKYIKIQARWPDQRNRDYRDSYSSRVNFLTGHYLSMKGYSHFWFSNKAILKSFLDYRKSLPNTELIEKYRNPNYRFRISESYLDLPDNGEIINSLFGIPLPFRGGDVLFHGGLKPSSSGGLVMNLSGRPGVGKTSIALSLAALLSPLNTKTIYISLEEDPEDLYRRLSTLIPDYFKELSIYKKFNGLDETDWLSIFKIEEGLDFEQLSDLLTLIGTDINQENPDLDETLFNIPAICPLYVVIDNINELSAGYEDSSSNYRTIEKFIKACRELGAFVILISSEDVPDKLRLNYLVDISVHAKQTGTDNNLIKPNRIFELNKTRHQISRQGSHIFHLTGSVGFRISPQIPSQMDRKEKIKRLLPDKTKTISTLNIIEDGNLERYNYFLDIFPGSQILLHGQGSAGKAGLALKILLTPPIDRHKEAIYGLGKRTKKPDDPFKNFDFSQQHFQRKVLIISFLYPQEYYEELIQDRITIALKRVYKHIRNAKFKIIPFSPGYLAAEDFINKIIRTLDEAILDGEPFTRVMLDGLHNVFLQFKNLQENDMVWPLLYSILSRYNVTVISTFTNFRINSVDNGKTAIIEDQQLMQKGQTPLLHSMVKACDFYIALEEIVYEGRIRYQISIRSAIDQPINTDALDWNRQSLKVTKWLGH